MNENVLPLFTEDQMSKGKEALDKLTFKKGAGDIVDGPIYGFALHQLNKYASPYVPDYLKPNIQDVLNEILEGDFDDAGAELADVVADILRDAKLKDGIKEIIIGVLNLVKGAVASID
jgi:hypothetical protein